MAYLPGITTAAGKTLTVNNSLTLAGTDATVMTFPTATDTVVGLNATQSPLSKTLDGSLASNPDIIKLNQSGTTPANPTGTTSTTQVMAGLAVAFTPRSTGRMLVVVTMRGANSTAASGALAQIRFGTGTAPTNGAAATGTAVGAATHAISTAANEFNTIALTAIITGATVGTALWVDLGEAAVTSGTATLTNISVSIVEI